MSGGAPTPDWDEIDRTVAALLELPEERRAAFLAQQPPAIRAEVESLLAAYRRSGSFLGGEPSDVLLTVDILDRMKAMLALGEPEKAAKIHPGLQLGQYRIENILGEGGMGIVYRALDARLNRPVAIKFLFDDLADETGRHRFQREAQMASSLNHPHILTVYDAGDFEGRQYLVTEFIDGGTLKAWARVEKRTWKEIITLLVGVADGLATAHEAGILHRDIKPDNILIGRNGYAKLSDFGLAKLEAHSTPEALTRTISRNSTKAGMIVGTFAYMSPEQASGRAADARGDIFSFGVVLFELLAGRRPFEAPTDLELLQAVRTQPAPPLPADVPYPLRMIVEKALEKDPAERYQSTRDLVVDMRRLTRQSGESSGPANTVSVPPSKIKLNWKMGVIATVIVAALLVAAKLWLPKPISQAPGQVVQFDIILPPGSIFVPPTSRQPFAVSPDGKRLAFTATGENGTHLWIRDFASPEMRMVPGTEGAWSMFWAPDSQSIFFSVKQVLKQANPQTGSTQTVADLPNIPRLGTWRSNGDLILFLQGRHIWELRLSEGTLREAPRFADITWPQFLPGLDRLLYPVGDKELQHSRAVVTDYVSRKQVTLMQTDSRVQYAPPLRTGEPGYLVFIRGASLLAQPFDADQLRLTGEPIPIAQNVIYYSSNLAAAFSVAANGLVYQSNFPVSQLNWYDRSGKPVGQAGRPAMHWGQVRASREGLRVAATVWSPETGGTGIWTFDASGKESRSLTFGQLIDRRPVWSPDGKRLATGRSPVVGGSNLAIIDAFGSVTQEVFVTKSPNDHLAAVLPTDWSGDGRFIAADEGLAEEQHTVWIGDVVNHTMTPLLRNNFSQAGAAFSPDSQRLAFVSLESGRPEVYVQGFEPEPSPHVSGNRRQVSRDGAWLVRWRADGRELFYIGLDNALYAVQVTGPLAFGEPKRLFSIPGATQYGTTRDFQFDVSPKGDRFIIPTTGSVPPPPFTVIENWQSKLH